MQAIYAKEAFPRTTTKSIFLAGPTPRDATPSWRPDALQYLESVFDGHVFVPEDRVRRPTGDYDDQVEWETEGLNRADAIVFWVPRNVSGGMPAFTTNVEFGEWYDSGKAFYGRPDWAEKVRYLDRKVSTQNGKVYETLPTLLDAAVASLDVGATRTDGDATVPLMIWRHPTFKAWLKSQKHAGNELIEARVKCVFPKGPKPFLFMVHAKVWITKENRAKINEVVIGRSDVAHVILFHRGPSFADHQVVLVREFRTPARTFDGMIHETPGGSSKAMKPIEQVALEEVEEEVGITLRQDRLRRIGERQLAGTLSCHAATVFVVELIDAEVADIKAYMGQVRGVATDSERTFTEIATIHEILTSGKYPLDWANTGMVLAALAEV